MGDDLKPALAELIGTFTLVFIGAGAGALAGSSGSGLVGVALAHGMALTAIIYAWGNVSGAHVNPAVTFSIALTGKMPWRRAFSYWTAQLAGAVLAGYLLLRVVGAESGLGATTGSLTTSDTFGTILVEAILTFFLVIAVFGSAVAGRNAEAVGLAIGLVLTADILAGGPLTGASMNPARTFGPALAIGDLSYMWMYIVGPFTGGGLAALVYDRLFLRKP